MHAIYAFNQCEKIAIERGRIKNYRSFLTRHLREFLKIVSMVEKFICNELKTIAKIVVLEATIREFIEVG